MNIIQKILLQPIYFYKKYISPLFPAQCRYYPSCSQYMIDAIKIHGALKGFLMGIVRILRCNPFFKGGIDYVPLKFSLKKNADETYYGPYTKEHIHSILEENKSE